MRIIYQEMRKRKKVALFMGLSDTFEHGIARGVARFARARSDWILFGYGWMFRPLEALEYWEGDGIIARVESPADADRLAALDIPVVDVAGAYLRPAFLQVTNDDWATGMKAGEYLRSCGFQRFAFCGVRGAVWSERRKAGFRESVRELCPRVEVFEESLPWWESLENPEQLGGWLSGLSCPLGVFACNDTAGLKLSELARKLGIGVPSELAVLGVDNEDILCELAFPPLSSILLDCEVIGYRAAELLAGILSRPRAQARVRIPILLPPKEIVERESTRVFACGDPLVDEAVRRIQARARDGVTVAELIAGLPASRRNLEMRFRRATGRTLHQEIVRARLEVAKALLRSTSQTMARVARDSGFGTLQRFHEVFRARVGSSPARYRRDRRRE
jgi:LacI family transcriptional regulator